MTELFNIPETLSPREQWAADNGVVLDLDRESDVWTAKRGDDEAESDTRARAIDELAFALRKHGVKHWNEEGGE